MDQWRIICTGGKRGWEKVLRRLSLAVTLVVLCVGGPVRGSAPTARQSIRTNTLHLPRLTLQVRFAASLDRLGINEQEVRAKIESDLRAELGDSIALTVVAGQDDFVERFQTALNALDQKYEVSTTQQQAKKLSQALINANQAITKPVTLDTATTAAIQAYEHAVQAFDAELAASTNLAALPRGALGLLLTPTPGYGGQTFTGGGYPQGERWSLLFTGLAASDFATTDPTQTKAHILQYLANATKQQLGRQFGLQTNQAGLQDAMANAVDRGQGEHLLRDSEPVHFNEQDGALLRQHLRTWAVYDLFLPQVARQNNAIQAGNHGTARRINPGSIRLALSSPATPTFWPPILTTIGEGLGLITGAAEMGGWLGGSADGGDKAEVTKGFPKADFDVELGLAYQFDYEVEYRFVDHWWRSSEYAFFELYIVFNDAVIYYHRYPESGYITNPDNWSDDSQSQKFQGSVYLGAEKWPCKNVSDEIKLVAIAWRDSLQLHKTGKNKWVHIDENGKEVNGVPEDYYSTMGLTKLAEDNDDHMQVTVMNPYYIDVKQNDNGATKNHHDGLFGLAFDAVMNYTINYPNITVFAPEPREANVTINPLVSQGDWVFNQTQGELQFKFIPGPLAHDTKPIVFAGRHGDPDQHHPNVIVPYSDDYGATVMGENRIFIQQGNAKVPHPFTWQAAFRPEPNAVGCTPLPYAVNCADPHDTPTPTPTPTSTPLATPTATNTPATVEPTATATPTPTLTPTPKPVLSGVSSTFSDNGNGTIDISITVTDSALDGLIYDLELYNADQKPPWQMVQPLQGPQGWSPVAVTGGVGWVTGVSPLRQGQAVHVMVQVTPSTIGSSLWIHLTNSSHQNMGYVISQRASGT